MKNLLRLSPMKWSVIDRWPTHPGLIEAFSQHIDQELDMFSGVNRDEVVILFTAHSLPMSVVKRGDSYPTEIAATTYKIMERLNFSNPYRVCWQSKVGPKAWLTPSTEEMIKGLAIRGYRHALLVPVAFVNDHIETLHELDIEYADELAASCGMTEVRRARSLNDNATFLSALAEIVKNHLVSGEVMSKQLKMRCPKCINPSCGIMRDFFSKGN